MVFPLGVPTPIEILHASHKLFRLYEEARGRQAKVHAANQLLRSTGTAIDKLEQADGDQRVDNSSSTLAQVRTARTAWRALHEHLQKFPEDVQSRRSLVPRARIVYDDLRWAFNILDGKVSELEQEIGLSLLAVIPTQIADLQGSMALLTAQMSQLRSSPILQAAPDKSLIVRTPSDPNFSSDLSASDVRSVVPLKTELADACWTQKGGCHCRCHSKTFTALNASRYTCIETQGWQAFGKTCSVEKCNARFICVQLHLAATCIWIPWAITIALRFDTGFSIPRISFTPSRVCRYTSPGFIELAKMSREYGTAFGQRVASFKLLFSNGQASHTDVRPDGDGYLDLILRGPWPPGMRDAQWDLVKFLIVGAPESVLRNPRLLHHCARWIGEGPHMDMLATLLSFGLDPEHFDCSLFPAWPLSCDPGWLAEDLAPDPMFIDFLRACLQRQPGFAGCDDLTEAVLTGEDSEFESALRRATGESGVLRTLPNALGQTATHLAITSPRRLERLLQAGADPDCVDRGGLTPLMYAAAYGEQQSVLFLVEHHATWHLEENRYSRNFLDYAICRRKLHVIETLIRWLRRIGDHDISLEVLDYCIAHCVMQYNDHYDVTIPHQLFELGADADTIVNCRTLLHLAKTPLMSQLIVKTGFTSFHIRDDSGKSPFMQVAHLVDAETLATFAVREEVADFNEQDMDGQTALHHLIRSCHAGQIYNYLGTDRSWQFARHRDMVSCLDTLLHHGASASTADNCVCACSVEGCTPLTFALHGLSRSFHIDCGSIFDLFQAAKHQINPINTSEWVAAIRRYHAFEEQGLTHTCCGARAKDAMSLCYRLRPETLANARTEQIQVMANFHSQSSEKSWTDDSIISSLAALCSMYEERSIAKNKSSVAQRRRKSQLQVDYAQDEITFCLDVESRPAIRKLRLIITKIG